MPDYISKHTGPAIDNAVDQIKTVGSVEDLLTTNKENVVSAVNEVKSSSDGKMSFSNMPGFLQAPLSESKVTLTATDVQVNYKKLQLQINGTYKQTDDNVTINGATEYEAGILIADDKKKLNNVPANTNETLSKKADLVNGLVPSSQLPGFVDDVIEGELVDTATFKDHNGEVIENPASGKIYSDIVSNKCYRWGGTQYSIMGDGIALGETSTTAYRGDRGKEAYDHSKEVGNPHGTSKSDVGLGNVNNTADTEKPVSSAQAKAISDSETKDFLLRFDKTGLDSSVSDGSTLNLLSLISKSDVTLAANTLIDSWTLSSGILKFPLPKNNPYVDYRIRVRLTGTIGGLLNPSREFGVELRRADDSLVERSNVIKVSGNNISHRGQSFESYTNGSDDPFIVSGIKIPINNDSGQTITVTGVTILIKGITK